ncbi:aminoglycoside phosphotransferase (APT) family kinase protein [Kineosphaera limosa]|nr:aminoglycoside phosphotransferase (APT) family kinase protein [Kineosphaera limosa]
MTRSAWTLAALADAAVPGLRPRLVEELVDRVGERFRVGFIEGDDGRRWVVRVPSDAVAAAQLEESAALAGLIADKVPFAVPESAGVAPLRDGRRAVVYPLIAGRSVDFALLPAGPGLTTAVVAAVAAVHNLDRRVFEEAGVPAYEADDLRRRRQADVDRGAATGLVPTGLLARWERMLDDVSWWRFAPTPVHGRLHDDHLLLRFGDPDDSATAQVVGITSWESAQIGDPAEDLAALLALAPTETADTVLEAYAGARHEPADGHLADRASLLAELEYLSELLTARRLGDRRHLTQATEALRRLDDLVSHGRGSGNRSGTAVDRLPVDFDADTGGQDLYQAGGPTRRIGDQDEQAPKGAQRNDSTAAADPPGDESRSDTTGGESRSDTTGASTTSASTTSASTTSASTAGGSDIAGEDPHTAPLPVIPPEPGTGVEPSLPPETTVPPQTAVPRQTAPSQAVNPSPSGPGRVGAKRPLSADQRQTDRASSTHRSSTTSSPDSAPAADEGGEASEVNADRTARTEPGRSTGESPDPRGSAG